MFTDDEIITSVLEGKKQNFETLINRYKNKLVNFIYQMIADYDEAQNIAQEVFVKIYVNLKNYQKKNNFQAFLYRVAKNLTINWINKQKRVQFFSKLPRGDVERRTYHQEKTPEQAAENQQANELLLLGLKQLVENQRIALILKVYLELSYQEIRDITGWSIPKIETLISRARGNLKKYFSMQENANFAVLKIER